MEELRCGGACVDPQTNAAHCSTCGHTCESDACVDGACTVRPCAEIGSTANPVCFVDAENREIYDAVGAQVFGVATPTCTSNAECADAYRLCAIDDVTCLCTVGYAVDPFGYVRVAKASRRRPVHAQGGVVSLEQDVTSP